MILLKSVLDTDLHECVLGTGCLISYLNWKMKCRNLFTLWELWADESA